MLAEHSAVCVSQDEEPEVDLVLFTATSKRRVNVRWQGAEIACPGTDLCLRLRVLLVTVTHESKEWCWTCHSRARIWINIIGEDHEKHFLCM